MDLIIENWDDLFVKGLFPPSEGSLVTERFFPIKERLSVKEGSLR